MLDHVHSVLHLKARPPAVPPGLVPRTDLAARLTAAVARPVTLVSAGPGAGKTMTVASWATSDAPPWSIGWLSLDPSDDGLAVFWSHLIFAVLGSGAVPQDSGLRDLTPASEFGVAEVIEVRVRLAELPVPVVLVLDDVHEITNDAVLQTLGELVDDLPATLRLVLLSRADPPLRLHRLRVSGQLTEIRTDDLAFTEPETAELFAGAGIGVDAHQVSVLHNRTEGWPAGLRLAAMSLDPGDVQAGIDRFSGSQWSVAEYLVGEVTRRLSPGDRDFLLATSVLDTVSGAQADYLTGRSDSQRLLERFAQANAFVIGLGGGHEWFRFHPLLRELMLHRLGLERPSLALELHRRAASWMAGQGGDPIGAIRHLILAREWQDAGRTMLTVLPMLLTPDGPVLAAAVEPLAARAIDTPSFSALLASATCHFHRHEFTAMLRDVEEVKDFLDEAGDDERPAAEVVIRLYEMVAATARGDAEAVITLTSEVVNVVDHTPRQRLSAGRQFRAIARVNLAGAQLWTSAHDDDGRLLKEAAAEALELGLLRPHLNAIGHLALLDALHGRNQAADRQARQALHIIDRRGWGSEPQAPAVYLALAMVGLARQQTDDANAYVKRGLAASGGETDRAMRLALGVVAVQTAVSSGDAAAALLADSRLTLGLARTPTAPDLLVRWAAVAAAEALLLAGRPDDAAYRIGTVGDSGSFIAGRERACLARVRLALDDIPAAEGLIEPLLQSGQPDREPAVTAWLLQALLTTRKNRDAAALKAISTAIDLAEPEGIRRPFLLIDKPLPDLLARHRQLGGRHNTFAAELIATMKAQTTPEVSPLLEPLTEREAIVLRYLPTMLKAGEIGADLFVSVNTVKAHLRSVYRKLGVNNRREAVERARAAGLL